MFCASRRNAKRSEEVVFVGIFAGRQALILFLSCEDHTLRLGQRPVTAGDPGFLVIPGMRLLNERVLSAEYTINSLVCLRRFVFMALLEGLWGLF